MAGGAFVVAVRAAGRDRCHRRLGLRPEGGSGRGEQNADAAATANTSLSIATTEPVAAAPSVAATSSGAAAGPRVQYFPELTRAERKIDAPTGCNSAYVDVDTMAIGNAVGHEFYVSLCKDPANPEVRVDRTSGASTSGPNPSPEVCASLISGTSTAQELILTARAGLTFCLLTNKSDATSQGLPQRLAIIEVRDVGLDHSVTIAVSTYRLG
jgi:hypothetical protein